jgi:FMN phosphatase YigB (HAD superfamily)
VDAIKAVLFEPVGCLAEFRPDEFNDMATRLSGASADPSATGSQAYWQLMSLLASRDEAPAASEEIELQAVEHADLYPDVRGCLDELRQLGVAAYLVTSLSRAAAVRFLERFSIADVFSGLVSREDAGGVGAQPLRHAASQTGVEAARIMALVDTGEALDAAKSLGLNTVLMINDYDEGRALAERSPTGGIVSLAELPDALRLIEQREGLAAQSRLPKQPFDLFEPT